MKVVSIKATGEMLSVGRTTVYRLIGEGSLLTIKIGRRRLVKIESIEALIEQEAA